MSEAPANVAIQDRERAALDELLAITEQPTDEAFWVADFLLAWYQNRAFAGFDSPSVQQMDAKTLSSVLIVVGLISRTRLSPDALGYGRRFELLGAHWR